MSYYLIIECDKLHANPNMVRGHVVSGHHDQALKEAKRFTLEKKTPHVVVRAVVMYQPPVDNVTENWYAQ